MKAKNLLMSILLVTGSIAAKAAGYPPELTLVSQPMMVYHTNSITVYYDVENIGDYTYRGSVCLYLYPDEGYSYAEEWVKVRPGHIKRIALEIPAHRIRRGHPFTIMPYYELGDELYSFTTFEYFEPITFFWEGPHNEPWVVINIGPCPRYYHRPGHYRYYYDGFRPPMPPTGHEPRPMDPKHHTYGYHHNNGGYPGHSHHEGMTPPKPNNNGNTEAPSATVRPKANAGSMSSVNHNNGASTGSATSGSSSGRVSGSSSGNNSSRRTNNSGSSSGRVSGTNNSSSRPAASSGSSSSVRRESNSSSNRSGYSSGSTRSSSSSSSTRSSINSNSSSSRNGASTRGR